MSMSAMSEDETGVEGRGHVNRSGLAMNHTALKPK